MELNFPFIDGFSFFFFSRRNSSWFLRIPGGWTVDTVLGNVVGVIAADARVSE